MFLADISVKRPIAMLCLIIGLALLGSNAYRKMGVELFPQIDVPYITVVTAYPGAGPEQLEVDVAKKIEDQAVTISGLKNVVSTCMENVVQTLLEFEMEIDVDLAAMDVREKIDLIKNEFPEDVEDPIILKFDINAKPVITLALTGNYPVEDLYDYADNYLRDKISPIEGVADVTLLGGSPKEVQLLLDRNRLASRNLTSLDVVNAVNAGMRSIPSGRIVENDIEYSVEFKGEFDNIEDIYELEIANINAQRIYIRDVAAVRHQSGELREMTYVNGQPAIGVQVVKRSDANTVNVVNAVRNVYAELLHQLPDGMDLHWLNDEGNFVESTVNSAWMNVFQGILLTALILFLFLHNLRSLIIVAITMPLIIIIGLFFMHSMDFTLNMSTLLAIGMSVGILVTNTIVVLESIISKFDECKDAKKAAISGVSEVALAVIASAGTNLVVLFPIAIMGSLVGLFLRPLALTMLIMTVISLFISFTLTPLLASLILKEDKGKKNFIIANIEKFWNKWFKNFTNQYRGFLILCNKKKYIAVSILVVIGLIFFHSVINFGSLGLDMISETDMGEIIVKIEFPTYYSIQNTETRIKEIENRLKDVPEILYVFTTIGKMDGVIGGASEGVYLAQLNLFFTSKTARVISLDQIDSIIRSKLTDLPDSIISINRPSPVGGSGTDLEVDFSGPYIDKLNEYALLLKQELENRPGYKDVDVSARIGKPKLVIEPNRAILSDMNITPVNLGLLIRANLEGLNAGTFKKGDRSYDITVKLKDVEGGKQLNNFLVPAFYGHPITLESFGKVEEIISPIQITRRNKQRIAKLYSNLDGLALGPAANEITDIINTKFDLEPGYDFEFTGMYEKMAEAQTAIGEAGIIAVVLLILVLAAILESYKQPVIILMTLPLMIPGMYWALNLAGYSISIFVSMSAVMLIGIVVNNAILILTEYNSLVKKGIPQGTAMNKAAVDQMRPIIMITLAAVLGMMPLAFGTDIGSEFRNDIGMSSIGGIFVSGIFTMIVIPLVFKLRKNGKKK